MESNDIDKQEVVQTETGLTAEAEQTENSEPSLNPCQGYLVNPVTKLHLCQTCVYHKWRNESKPWLKKVEE